MLGTERISDAFKGGRADPHKSLDELERFYQQAKWLGECAEYIYPPPIDHSNEARMKEWEPIWSSFVEQYSDSMQKDEDAKAAREKWEHAINEFVQQMHQPPTTSRPSPAQEAYSRLDENGLDAIADKLQSERGKLFPTLRPWKWFTVTEPMRLATQKYELAHRLWSTRAESRIRDYIIQTWAAEGANAGGITKVEFGSKNGIEYFLASNDELVILCFRGTEMHKMGDIITDMRAWQVEVPEKKKALNDEATKALHSKADSTSAVEEPRAPLFHQGFWDALQGVWDEIGQNEVWEAFKTPTQKQVWITGHSLGGALATLAAYRLVRDGVITSDQISGVFTFGQPRVGDGKFVGGYSSTRDRHYRFVNNCDIVTMIPPKSISWLIAAASIVVVKLSSKKKSASAQPAISKTVQTGSVAEQTDAVTLKVSYGYADVGKILFLNRASQLKLVQPKFWWPFELMTSRLSSLLLSPFVNASNRGVMERFVPGIADHSMQEYNRVLKIACAQRAFVRELIAKMKERSDLQSRPESVLQKSAEQAWMKLRAGADREAWDAKRKVNSAISAAKVQLNKLVTELPENASEIAQVKFQLAELDQSKAGVWLKTWHAALSEKRDKEIENSVSSMR